MTKRLLIITQRVDENDDLLGFFVAWIREFSQHFEQVSVITLAVGTYQLPANVRVYSLGKEQGISKWQQALSMMRLLWQLTPSHGGVFCHMSPIFAVLAWPLARLRASKLVLWYLHRSRTARLRLALVLSDHIVTADAASLTIKSPKIISTGHGIDTVRFAVDRNWLDLQGRPLRILSVGRLSPIKDFETLINTAALLKERGMLFEVRIIGRAVMEGDSVYEEKLRRLVSDLQLSDSVKFVGFVPYVDMPAQYRWADMVVGCTPRGGIDKVMLEAMAAGCIVMTSNTVMDRYVKPYDDRLLFTPGDSAALSDRIAGLSDYSTVSAAMIASVREHHNLESVIARISAVL